MRTSFFLFMLFAQDPVTAGVADPKVPPQVAGDTMELPTQSISRPVVALFCRGTACGEWKAAQLVSRSPLVCIVEVP